MLPQDAWFTGTSVYAIGLPRNILYTVLVFNPLFHIQTMQSVYYNFNSQSMEQSICKLSIRNLSFIITRNFFYSNFVCPTNINEEIHVFFSRPLSLVSHLNTYLQVSVTDLALPKSLLRCRKLLVNTLQKLLEYYIFIVVPGTVLSQFMRCDWDLSNVLFKNQLCIRCLS